MTFWYSMTALSYFFFSTYFWAAASTLSRSIATTRIAPRLWVLRRDSRRPRGLGVDGSPSDAPRRSGHVGRSENSQKKVRGGDVSAGGQIILDSRAAAHFVLWS